MFFVLVPFVARAQDDDPFDPKNKAPAAPKAVETPNKARRPPTADRIDFTVSVQTKPARRGQIVELTIAGKPRPGFHTYPLTQRTPAESEDFLSTLTYANSVGLRPLPPVKEEPAPEFVIENKDVYLEYSGPFTWTQDILILPDAVPGEAVLKFTVRLQVCDKSCVWGEHQFEVPIRIADDPPIPLTAVLQDRLKAPPAPVKVVAPPQNVAVAGRSADSGLVAFMLTGVFWGAVSLITPCVFPMIPITVSFFLKQSEKQHHRPLTMACVYCATIIVVLTISAVALLSFFREFSTDPYMNFALGALFVFFALSLFGMYEIELPSSLARFTSAREGKGGLIGTMFMALTFTIISFACVAPFLGGFGGTAANSTITWTHRVLGGLAFSVTFASPFFVLALFPTLLKKMPKSGRWLNSVKVVMGFLELAAALKFFRSGEIVFLPEPMLFTYDFSLGLYIALSLASGLYLLNLYRLPHDTPAEHLSVPQLILSVAFIGLALHMTPGLFKNPATGQNQRPGGAIFAWVDSFLLPDTKSTLPWVGSLDKGLATGLKDRKLVFVDFTGETCTNCKLNEETVFSRKEIQDLLLKYALVQLFTDKVPNRFYSIEDTEKFGSSTKQQREDARTNLQFQRDRFNTEQLPLYVILQPLANGQFKEIARYDEGKINDISAFAQFLSRNVASAEPVAQAR